MREHSYARNGTACSADVRLETRNSVLPSRLSRADPNKTDHTARYTDAYLETGPNNRLVLSIRSGVPAEIDFGLDRLVQMTSIEPDLVRLSEFPGLLDGCLAIVRDYLERRKADRERGLPALAAIVGQEARSVLRRRAGEAALILRNLAPESRSRDPLLASKKLLRTICDVLEEGQSDALDGEETTEIRIYLLDVLECIAEHVPLALPGHPIAAGAADAADDGDKPPPKPEALDSPAVRLFPLLVALTRSSDRALLLAGFRTLTALALNGKSDAVFALLAYNGIEPLPKPHPHPIQTAVELLPVADTELNLAILEFIYQHTLLPSNAVLFAERPELVGILRLLISKFHVRAKLEEVSIDLRVAPFDGRYYHDLHGVKHVRKPTPNPIQPTDSLVSPEELAHLITLVEPSRTLTWMRTAFEADPASSVPQVVLWTSYRTQFEPHARPDLPPLLAAAEVIKASQQAFPNVLPMVSEEGGQRNFVIKGLKIRDRPGTRPPPSLFFPVRRLRLTQRAYVQTCAVGTGVDGMAAKCRVRSIRPPPHISTSWKRTSRNRNPSACGVLAPTHRCKQTCASDAATWLCISGRTFRRSLPRPTTGPT